MGTNAPPTDLEMRKTFIVLTKLVRTETSPEMIVDRLQILKRALQDEEVTDMCALIFVRNGGLPTLIRHLKGVATSDGASNADVTPAMISAYAGETLHMILNSNNRKAELVSPPGIIPPLIDALRDAPHVLARTAAAQALLLLVLTQPAGHRAMVDAGVMGAVAAYFIRGKNSPMAVDKAGPTWDLAQLLLCSQPAAVRDLRLLICGPDTEQAFTALLILHVRHSCTMPRPPR
jgi:hypothetical protein